MEYSTKKKLQILNKMERIIRNFHNDDKGIGKYPYLCHIFDYVNQDMKGNYTSTNNRILEGMRSDLPELHSAIVEHIDSKFRLAIPTMGSKGRAYTKGSKLHYIKDGRRVRFPIYVKYRLKLLLEVIDTVNRKR